MRRILGWLVAAGLGMTPLAVMAQQPIPDYQVAIGAGGIYKPKYIGSDSYTVTPWPFIYADYKDTITLEVGSAWLEPDNLKISLLKARNYKAGLIATYSEGRKRGDDTNSRNIHEVDPAVEAGVFFSFFFDNWKFDWNFRQDVSGAHDGWLSDFGVTWGARLAPNVKFEMGPKFTVASKNYMNTEFGITAADSTASGLQRTTPDAGIRDASFGGRLTYNFTENWFAMAWGQYMYLLGDAGDSPVAKSQSQIRMGLMGGYKF